MAELLSVQVHAPLVRDEDTVYIDAYLGSQQATRLKKIENRQATTARSLTQRMVDIEFNDLSYTVSEGRRKGLTLESIPSE